MDSLAMILLTVPILFPLVCGKGGLGFDPIWFGIMIVIVVEMGMITPPVGMNLFVVQSLRKSGSMNAVIIGSQPFVLALFVMLALLAFFPEIALWLPHVFGGY